MAGDCSRGGNHPRGTPATQPVRQESTCGQHWKLTLNLAQSQNKIQEEGPMPELGPSETTRMRRCSETGTSETVRVSFTVQGLGFRCSGFTVYDPSCRLVQEPRSGSEPNESPSNKTCRRVALGPEPRTPRKTLNPKPLHPEPLHPEPKQISRHGRPRRSKPIPCSPGLYTQHSTQNPGEV